MCVFYFGNLKKKSNTKNLVEIGPAQARKGYNIYLYYLESHNFIIIYTSNKCTRTCVKQVPLQPSAATN